MEIVDDIIVKAQKGSRSKLVVGKLKKRWPEPPSQERNNNFVPEAVADVELGREVIVEMV